MQSFVHRNNTNKGATPPRSPAPGKQLDLAARQALANDARVPGPSKYKDAQKPLSRPSSTTPILPHDSYQIVNQNLVPPRQYSLMQSPPRQKSGFDDDVSSNFDVTKSEIPSVDNYQQGYQALEQGKLYREQNQYPDPALDDYQVERLHTKTNNYNQELPLILPEQGRQLQSNIVGRFEPAPQQKKNARNPLQPAFDPAKQFHNRPSRKRSRSQARRLSLSHGRDHLSEDELDNAPLPQAPSRNGFHGQDLVRTAGFDDMDTTIASEDSQTEDDRQKVPPMLSYKDDEEDPDHSRSVSPEWDEKKLEEMQYSDVQAMSWEFNHKAVRGKKSKLPKELRQKNITLEEKIKLCMGQEKDIQFDFYQSLSTTEWEEAGTWFANKFSEMLKAVQDKKAEKRAMIESFEAEVDKREKAVRGKSANFEKKLKEMRTSGEEVLRGKTR